MSSQPNNPNKLAFSSICIPGSVAEQKEKERLAEFKRAKAQREAAEERDRPKIEAARQAAYLANWQANQNRLQRDRAVRAGRNKIVLP